MATLARMLWLIPLFPLAAAGVIALLPRSAKRAAMGLGIGAMGLALAGSVAALAATVLASGTGVARVALNFDWFRLGTGAVRLGVVLDPMSSAMLLMVSFVGLLIFVFSTGYMASDENVTRFFCFLSLFAAAMLGLVMSNSLLLFFGCWEVMGLASYLLIGFWFHKPSAAAAAKKAFVVTRIGDVGLFLGLVWLYGETGTSLFYAEGAGCLEQAALARLTSTVVTGTLTAATAIGLLLFVGAVGKSGQLPLHVWLPDAMEGPTPVSALIHAATMVAAGVFLVARVFPIMAGGLDVPVAAGGSMALNVVTVVGSLTAVFAALIAVAQTDIKRILAYSTVSQLGYMFLGLGTGGVAVGMFHLITHAFFKALLFLGSGSVIHGCHHEQDIRRMGGLRKRMPVTFATYAIGMMALSGVPLVFSGFWSKDEILHTAWLWQPSRWPFALGLGGAFLTAFYMTRQMFEVFAGAYRGDDGAADGHGADHGHGHGHEGGPGVQESPRVMTVPLTLLAVAAVSLGVIGTPAWPWFEGFLNGHAAHWDTGRLVHALPLMGLSTVVVGLGIGAGWRLYGRRTRESAGAPDVLEARIPAVYRLLGRRLLVDELYEYTVVMGHRWGSALMRWIDEWIIAGLVLAVGGIANGLAWVSRWVDEFFVNAGFDAGCETARWLGRGFSRVQNGNVQRYLGWMGLGAVVLGGVLIWGIRPG